MAKGIGYGAALLIAGAGGWMIWKMANAQAAPGAAPLVDAGGRVTQSIPGVTVDAEGGAPIIQTGESSESAADRWEAWGWSTGQDYPTMLDGYGAGAMDAWYAQPVYGSMGDYVQLPYSGMGGLG
jgi:hypothetical protein